MKHLVQRLRLAVLGCVSIAVTAVLAQTGSAAVLAHRYPFDTDANDVIGAADGLLQGNAVLTNGGVFFDGTNSGVQLPNDLFTNTTSISFELWFVDQVSSNLDACFYQFTGSNALINCTAAGQGSYISNLLSQKVIMPDPIPGLTNHLVWSQDSTSKVACLYLNGILAAKRTNFTLTPVSIGLVTNSWLGAAGPGAAVMKGGILEFRVYRSALTSLEVAQLNAAGPDNPQVSRRFIRYPSRAPSRCRARSFIGDEGAC